MGEGPGWRRNARQMAMPESRQEVLEAAAGGREVEWGLF